MNTSSPNPSIDRALELFLEHRHGTLEGAFALEYRKLLKDPVILAEVQALERFSERFSAARILPSADLLVATSQYLESGTTAAAVPSSSNVVSRGWRWMWGGADGQPWALSKRTVLCARALALYSGVAAALVLFLFLRQPSVQASESVYRTSRTASEPASTPGLPTPQPSRR